MNVKPIWGGLLAAIFLAASAQSGRAENARLPYRQIYNLQKLEIDLSPTYTNLQAALTMESVRPDVKINNLKVYIDSKTGRIPIPIGSAGDFILPMSEDLLEENPWIITNQPRGTMKLGWLARMDPRIIDHMTNSIHYAQLMRPVRDCDDFKAQMTKLFPGTPKLTTTGLKLIFPMSQKPAAVTIHARDGARTLVANAEGEVVLPLTPDLMEDDPVLSFSEPPRGVETVSRQSAE